MRNERLKSLVDLGKVVLLAIYLLSLGNHHVLGEPFSVETDKGSIRVYEQSKALIIGSSKYRDKSWPALTTVPDDVASVEQALIPRI